MAEGKYTVSQFLTEIIDSDFAPSEWQAMAQTMLEALRKRSEKTKQRKEEKNEPDLMVLWKALKTHPASTRAELVEYCKAINPDFAKSDAWVSAQLRPYIEAGSVTKSTRKVDKRKLTVYTYTPLPASPEANDTPAPEEED